MFREVYQEIYLPDSTAITSGILRRWVDEGRIEGRIAIHSLLVSYFEDLARKGMSQGFIGLEELGLLRKSCEDRDGVEIEVVRDIPQGYRVSRDLNVDEVVRELARDWNATVITCDRIQYRTCIASGVKALFLGDESRDGFLIEKFFDDKTMSVHLKEGVIPYAKIGTPGKWKFKLLDSKPISRAELEGIVRNIYEVARESRDAFIEVERPGSTIIQIKNYRIVITRPPFSDGLEVTAVRPVIKLKLEDYNLPKKLIVRLEEKAEGILIAGAPGMGKTTFAQALAEYYMRKGKVVKTVESPRDMQLPDEITQYSKNYATSEEIHDVLLLSRPDYTVFDEMRDTKDFELYTDLRLAGIGLIGVVHATSAIDAIQRFVGRVELGMIPSIIDTVIFIKDGAINKVYELETTVKIPHGLREADLARPVVVVKDFLTGKPEYEMYVFGERTFVVPIKRYESKEEKRIRRSIEKIIRRYIPDESIDIDVLSEGKVIISIDPEYLPIIMGKFKKRIDRVGKRLGVDIEVRPKLS
ncbi:MAG: ATPase [Thermoprotei archaeon]|nr:MAG: ATPase [Thermoprotei archaeon]RLI92386.1 MAG: ATPase [Candidatus Altiarchaeales archaeon]